MATPSIYINLEDDVAKVAARIKRERSSRIVLVCPKRCQLFADSINLRLLKKQADLMGKEVFVMTMDEKGQNFAREAGFGLKFLPKAQGAKGVSDIKFQSRPSQPKTGLAGKAQNSVIEPITSTIQHLKNAASRLIHQPAQPVEPKRADETIKAEAVSPKVRVAEVRYPKEIETAYQEKRRRNYQQKAVTGLLALSLLIILLVVFVVLPSATVAVYPKTEPVTRDMEISASTKATAPNSDQLVLPATKIEETLDVNNKFMAQGKKEVGNPAGGAVQIYNFTRLPLNLKAATTVLTVAGKNYRLASDISGLKPAAYSDPRTKEVDQASLAAPVQIVAEQGGEAYNLPAGVRMEITNQVFGSKPQFLFAKTYSAVSGGTSRYLSVVTQADLDSARNSLGDQMLLNLNSELRQKNLAILEKSYLLDSVQFTADSSAGTQSPTFQADLKAKITGLAINQDSLKKLVIDHITQTLSSNKTLTAGRNGIDYKLKTVDLAAGQEILTGHFEGQAVMNINLDDAAKDLVGKTVAQATEILRSRAEVDRIEITLSPSWQQHFPFFYQKIHLQIATTGPDS
jgi:hypothetical protein